MGKIVLKLFRPAVFFLTVIAVLGIAAPAQAEKRIALVIGNGSYASIGTLRNPPNDARLLGLDAAAISGLREKGVI